MTIGLGFLCPDGVLLCADRQITKEGGLKYEERKIFWAHRWEAGICNADVGFTYSGDPDAAKTIFDKVQQCLPLGLTPQHRILGAPSDHMKEVLEKEVFNSKNGKYLKNLETLIAISDEGKLPFLIRTKDVRLVSGRSEYIGVGDSSVIRFISDVVVPATLFMKEAVPIGLYMVSLANRFIPGCSGGPDALWFDLDWKKHEPSPSDITKYMGVFPQFETWMRDRFLSLMQ